MPAKTTQASFTVTITVIKPPPKFFLEILFESKISVEQVFEKM